MSSLLDIQNQLIGFFLQKSVFSNADIQGIKVDADLVDKKEQAIRACLDTLQEMKIVKKIDDETWVLTAPLNSGGQEVHLSMAVCNEIAEVINMDLEAKDIDDRVSSLEIHEGHIVALLSIINELLSDDK